jgi:hypothetical protein
MKRSLDLRSWQHGSGIGCVTQPEEIEAADARVAEQPSQSAGVKAPRRQRAVVPVGDRDAEAIDQRLGGD